MICLYCLELRVAVRVCMWQVHVSAVSLWPEASDPLELDLQTCCKKPEY